MRIARRGRRRRHALDAVQPPQREAGHLAREHRELGPAAAAVAQRVPDRQERPREARLGAHAGEAGALCRCRRDLGSEQLGRQRIDRREARRSEEPPLEIAQREQAHAERRAARFARASEDLFLDTIGDGEDAKSQLVRRVGSHDRRLTSPP